MGPSEDLLRTPRTDYQALDQLMLYVLKSVNVFGILIPGRGGAETSTPFRYSAFLGWGHSRLPARLAALNRPRLLEPAGLKTSTLLVLYTGQNGCALGRTAFDLRWSVQPMAIALDVLGVFDGVFVSFRSLLTWARALHNGKFAWWSSMCGLRVVGFAWFHGE